MNKQDFFTILLAMAISLALYMTMTIPPPDFEDFGDTGVGCVDDCMDPLIEE